jgi:hypothetical protein
LVYRETKNLLQTENSITGDLKIFAERRSAPYSAATGSTETKDLLSFFFWKTTVPSTRANKVWSLPIPTLAPALCLVPR